MKIICIIRSKNFKDHNSSLTHLVKCGAICFPLYGNYINHMIAFSRFARHFLLYFQWHAQSVQHRTVWQEWIVAHLVVDVEGETVQNVLAQQPTLLLTQHFTNHLFCYPPQWKWKIVQHHKTCERCIPVSSNTDEISTVVFQCHLPQLATRRNEICQ